MEIWFTARRKFGPKISGWSEYINWSGLRQLVEVCSLDAILNPSFFQELTDEDWQHNIQEDFCISYFREADYVIERMRSETEPLNILAVAREPDAHASFADERFVFCGYDLIGEADISALTNCGGFEKAFDDAQLSKMGLLDQYESARKVQERLRYHYPDEHHADCNIWAIWRLVKNVVT
jgi:hypothetical protein